MDLNAGGGEITFQGLPAERCQSDLNYPKNRGQLKVHGLLFKNKGRGDFCGPFLLQINYKGKTDAFEKISRKGPVL